MNMTKKKGNQLYKFDINSYCFILYGYNFGPGLGVS